MKLTVGQILPRFWDVWHLYSIPPSERSLYRVLEKKGDLEIREYIPRLALEVQRVDITNPARVEGAQFLPFSAFTTSIQLKGKQKYRESWCTTSPLEVCVESYDFEKVEDGGFDMNGVKQARSKVIPTKRVTWHMSVPTKIGYNPEVPPPTESEPDRSAGERAQHVQQGKRIVAVMKYKGEPQDESYIDSRKKLLDAVKGAGYRTVTNSKGKSRVWIYMNGLKAGFSDVGALGVLCSTQSLYRPGNEIAVQLEP